ncbi:MAG: indolepyruvate ferredoxin oxidoreductase subunit alpha, partial [Deltaproteobacteria bacterium]
MIATTDPLLITEAGHSACLLGNEAIVRGALESGVGLATGYPGTPSSEVTDSFARISASRGIEFEYAVNEKIALELAFAASLVGARSICAMKHLGLMVAGDPLSTIPYIGTVGGMVIVSAGDPG